MYETLSDLRDCLQTCFDDSGDCRYNFFVSLGIPPADCSSIAIWLDGSRASRDDNGECCTSIYDTTINITITRCCMKSDLSVGFDPKIADDDARCFLDDLHKLRCCLSCNGCTLPQLGCGLVVLDVQLDQESYGACYSATISVRITEDCC